MTAVLELNEYRAKTQARRHTGPGVVLTPRRGERSEDSPPQRTKVDEIDRGAIDAAVGGDAEACKKIVSAFQGPIFNVIYRMVGGRYPNDVEDFAQDVFLKIFAALDRFDPDRGIKFSTWVFTFVKNYCIDLLKRKRRPVVSIDDGAPDEGRRYEPEGDEIGPAQRVIGGELGERIGLAVESLPEDQRLVFVLREYQGLDYRTIGNITGYAPGTVRSRLYRAKDALRARLSNYLRAEAL